LYGVSVDWCLSYFSWVVQWYIASRFVFCSGFIQSLFFLKNFIHYFDFSVSYYDSNAAYLKLLFYFHVDIFSVLSIYFIQIIVINQKLTVVFLWPISWIKYMHWLAQRILTSSLQIISLDIVLGWRSVLLSVDPCSHWYVT